MLSNITIIPVPLQAHCSKTQYADNAGVYNFCKNKNAKCRNGSKFTAETLFRADVACRPSACTEMIKNNIDKIQACYNNRKNKSSSNLVIHSTRKLQE